MTWFRWTNLQWQKGEEYNSFTSQIVRGQSKDFEGIEWFKGDGDQSSGRIRATKEENVAFEASSDSSDDEEELNDEEIMSMIMRKIGQMLYKKGQIDNKKNQ